MHDVVRAHPTKHAFTIAVMAVTLGGCATVRVSDVTSTSVSELPPAEILVEVINGLPANASLGQVADQVAFNLQTALLEKLTRAGLTVEPLAPGRSRSDAAVLRVSITEAKRGNALERFVVGFGVGRAELLARTDFERPYGATKRSMTAFNTSSGYLRHCLSARKVLRHGGLDPARQVVTERKGHLRIDAALNGISILETVAMLECIDASPSAHILAGLYEVGP